MLSNEIIKKVEDFVYSKPRSVDEVAKHINKNWRTADRYIQEMEKNFGTISTRVFREGTRGALKIVYWSAIEKVSHSIFQEKLENDILQAKWKEDFSAFDIFQFVKEGKKSVKVESEKSEKKVAFERISSLLMNAQKQILIFSGNLSFINFEDKKSGKKIIDILDELIKRGVSIKVLCRVDISGIKNVESLLSLNMKHGKELIEIHHRLHPIRATIVDKQFFDIKEIKEPTGNIKELDRKIFIFYNISDRDWVEWLSKIFWKIFSGSIDSKTRIVQMQKLKIKQ